MDINAWGAALTTSLATALSLFLGAIPRVIGFLVIIIIGWLISGVLAAAVAGLLRAIKFNVLAQNAGLQGFINNMGLRTDPSGLLANIVKWFVRLIVLVVAFDALGLPAVSPSTAPPRSGRSATRPRTAACASTPTTPSCSTPWSRNTAAAIPASASSSRPAYSHSIVPGGLLVTS